MLQSYVLYLRSEAAAEVAVNCDRHFHLIVIFTLLIILLFCDAESSIEILIL